MLVLVLEADGSDFVKQEFGVWFTKKCKSLGSWFLKAELKKLFGPYKMQIFFRVCF